MKKIFVLVILALALSTSIFATAAATATQCYSNQIATQTMQAYPVNAVATSGQANAIATATPGISGALATETAVGANAAATAACTTNQVNATATQAAINTAYTATETAVQVKATQTGTIAGAIAAWTATETYNRGQATAAVTAAMFTATAVQSGSNIGATATVTYATGTYNSTTQSVDAAYKNQSTAVTTLWSAGIAIVNAQVTANCKVCDQIASYTPVNTATATYTPTMPANNGIYFQTTPGSGKTKITFTKSNIQSVYLDSLVNTPCSVDFYNGNTWTAFRHVYICNIATPVIFSGITVTSLYIDYGLNTGTSTVLTTGLSSVVAVQVTPGTGVVAIATKTQIDNITIDSLVNTPETIKIADGSTYLVNVSITTLPAVIPFYGRYFTALNVNYGSYTGTSYVTLGGSRANVIYQATPTTGTYAVPTPGTFESRNINKITIDQLYNYPAQVNIYNGIVLFKTENIYSTPWNIIMGGASIKNMNIGYGTSTGTARVITQ